VNVPEAILTVREAVPGGAYVAVDAGFSKPLLSLLWSTDLIDSYFGSQGLSTMGYAIPAANALKLVHPSETVIGFMGDGSLMMRASEIAVAVELGICPIYVVFVDSTMTQIAVKQRRRKLRQVGVSFTVPSCVALAAAFGAIGYDVSTQSELREALNDALAQQRPALIGITIDASATERIFDLVRG
jgi:acetolactate synthase I/II/III large subunit